MADASYLRHSPVPGQAAQTRADGAHSCKGAVIANRGAPSGGNGKLSGQLLGLTAEDVASVRILYRDADEGSLGDGYLVAVAVLDVDGIWEVTGLNPALKYDVVARREGYNDVITAGVSPVPV